LILKKGETECTSRQKIELKSGSQIKHSTETQVDCPKKLDTIWGIFMERKVKYDYAFKLENAKLVLEKCYSCNYG
jgi:hypothetical protein